MPEGSYISVSEAEVDTEITEGKQHTCQIYLLSSIEKKSQSILMMSQEKVIFV